MARKNIVTLFGVCGAGKGDIGKIVSARSNREFISAGDIQREHAALRSVTIEAQAGESADLEHDYRVDREIIPRRCRVGKPVLCDARLGWHFLPESYKICLWCDDLVRFARLAKREGVTDVDKVGGLVLGRERDDRRRFERLYDIVYPPKFEMFHLIINTTNLTPAEGAKIIMAAID